MLLRKKVKLECDVCPLDKIDTFDILALLNAKFLRNTSDEFSFWKLFYRYLFYWNYFKNYWHGFFQNIKFKVNSLFFILSFILLICKFINNYISLFVNLETVLFFFEDWIKNWKFLYSVLNTHMQYNEFA